MLSLTLQKYDSVGHLQKKIPAIHRDFKTIRLENLFYGVFEVFRIYEVCKF